MTGAVMPETTDNIMRYLNAFNFAGNLMALPGHLSIFDRRMAAFIRAAIKIPQLMIYAGCFDTLSSDQRWLLFNQAQELQSALPDLASVYITSSINALEDLQPDLRINLRSSKGHHTRPT